MPDTPRAFPACSAAVGARGVDSFIDDEGLMPSDLVCREHNRTLEKRPLTERPVAY